MCERLNETALLLTIEILYWKLKQKRTNATCVVIAFDSIAYYWPEKYPDLNKADEKR